MFFDKLQSDCRANMWRAQYPIVELYMRAENAVIAIYS